jgi:hypothetical protein
MSDLSLKNNARKLLALLDEDPDLLAQIRPPRDQVELVKKPKTGEKVHSGKPTYKRSIDFEAIDLKADLSLAIEDNDYEAIAQSYYPLAHLLSY